MRQLTPQVSSRRRQSIQINIVQTVKKWLYQTGDKSSNAEWRIPRKRQAKTSMAVRIYMQVQRRNSDLLRHREMPPIQVKDLGPSPSIQPFKTYHYRKPAGHKKLMPARFLTAAMHIPPQPLVIITGDQQSPRDTRGTLGTPRVPLTEANSQARLISHQPSQILRSNLQKTPPQKRGKAAAVPPNAAAELPPQVRQPKAALPDGSDKPVSGRPSR